MARNRGENFSPEEKAYLVELVRHRGDAVESKKVDAASIKNKNNAWGAIFIDMKNHFSCR